MSYNANHTQIIPASEFNEKNLRFSEPTAMQSGAGKRIGISIVNSDGTEGDLVLETDVVRSFGLSINKYDDKKKQLSLICWDSERKTDNHVALVDVIHRIVETCKSHLMTICAKLDKTEEDISFLAKNLNPLFWKKNPETKKVMEKYGPTLYCKTFENGPKRTIYYDADTGKELDKDDIMNKPCLVRAAVQVESIFIGRKITLQLKIREADIQLIDDQIKILDLDLFDIENVVFTPVQEGDGVKRIRITYNDNGVDRPLIMQTDTCYSFGLTVNKLNPTKTQFPIVLWNAANKTARAEQLVGIVNSVCDKARVFLQSICESTFHMSEDDMKYVCKKLNPLVWMKNKETKQVMEGYGPTLYTKTIAFGKRKTVFYSAQTGQELDAQSILNQACNVQAVIQLESMYMSDPQITTQVKLLEAYLDIDNQASRLLSH